jgi:hypothetical protein
MRTSRRTHRQLKEYAETSLKFRTIKKTKYYFVMNTEYSGRDLGLATGGVDLRTFDFGAPFLSHSASLKYVCSIINFYMIFLFGTLF